MEEVTAAVFGDERRFWKICAVLFGTVAVVRGCDWPNTWIATQAQLSYSEGFVKRGLYGQLLTRPLHLYTLGRFALASYVITLTFLALLWLFARRSNLADRIGQGEVVALFFSSYCLTYLVHDIGYPDTLLAALALVLLLIRSDAARLLMGLPICVIALLFHEMFLLVFLPVVLFSFLLSYTTAQTPQKRRFALQAVVGLAVVNVGTTLAIAARPTLTAAQLVAIEAQIRAHARFHVEQNFFDVLGRSFGDNVRLMARYYFLSPVWLLQQLASVFFFLPVVALLWFCTLRMLRSAGLGSNRLALFGAGVATFAPLSMHLLGFDCVRWNSLVGVTAFLVLLTVCWRTEGPMLPTSRGFKNACIVGIVLSMSSGGSVITGRLLPYPFFNDPGFLRSVTTLLHADDPGSLPR